MSAEVPKTTGELCEAAADASSELQPWNADHVTRLATRATDLQAEVERLREERERVKVLAEVMTAESVREAHEDVSLGRWGRDHAEAAISVLLSALSTAKEEIERLTAAAEGYCSDAEVERDVCRAVLSEVEVFCTSAIGAGGGESYDDVRRFVVALGADRKWRLALGGVYSECDRLRADLTSARSTAEGLAAIVERIRDAVKTASWGDVTSPHCAYQRVIGAFRDADPTALLAARDERVRAEAKEEGAREQEAIDRKRIDEAEADAASADAERDEALAWAAELRGAVVEDIRDGALTVHRGACDGCTYCDRIDATLSAAPPAALARLRESILEEAAREAEASGEGWPDGGRSRAVHEAVAARLRSLSKSPGGGT